MATGDRDRAIPISYTEFMGLTLRKAYMTYVFMDKFWEMAKSKK